MKSQPSKCSRSRSCVYMCVINRFPTHLNKNQLKSERNIRSKSIRLDPFTGLLFTFFSLRCRRLQCVTFDFQLKGSIFFTRNTKRTGPSNSIAWFDWWTQKNTEQLMNNEFIFSNGILTSSHWKKKSWEKKTCRNSIGDNIWNTKCHLKTVCCARMSERANGRMGCAVARIRTLIWAPTHLQPMKIHIIILVPRNPKWRHVTAKARARESPSQPNSFQRKRNAIVFQCFLIGRIVVVSITIITINCELLSHNLVNGHGV